MTHPEHAKLRAAKHELQTDAIYRFYEWCASQGVELCVRIEYKNAADYRPVNFDRLIHDYAGIDKEKLESEKLAMLDELDPTRKERHQ